MSSEPNAIEVVPGGEIDPSLEATGSAPILLERDGLRDWVSIDREDGVWADDDPEAVREAVAATAGRWSDIAADALIAGIYYRREQGSRPVERP